MHARLVPTLTVRLAAAAFVALLFAACEHNPTEAGTLASITIAPNPTTLTVSTTGQYSAIGRDASGNVVGINPTWSVAALGGSINPSGLFTAGTITGTFVNSVTATVGSISARATVTVIAGAPATIVVTPTPVTLASGATQLFTSVVRDAANNVLAITPNWSIAAGGGTINSAGLFTAGTSAGTFTNSVTASVGAIAGTATVIVTSGGLATITVTPNPALLAPGATQLFTAVGKDGSGNVVPTPGLAWSVVAAGGTINAGSGSFVAGSVSNTFVNTVRATSGVTAGFATVTISAAPLVPLGAAAPFGILAGTAVTCISTGFIYADVGVSPGNTLSGFGGPCVQSGVQNLGDATASAAQTSLTTAYNLLAGMACGTTIVANLGGTTLNPGVYCSAGSIGVTGTVTLNALGNPNATWVFQAGSGLTTAGSVVLIGGAQAKNVYWQVGSSATLGTASAWQGNILALTSITLIDNATLNGRALARNGAVTLGTGNTINLP